MRWVKSVSSPQRDDIKDISSRLSLSKTDKGVTDVCVGGCIFPCSELPYYFEPSNIFSQPLSAITTAALTRLKVESFSVLKQKRATV